MPECNVAQFSGIHALLIAVSTEHMLGDIAHRFNRIFSVHNEKARPIARQFNEKGLTLNW
jgi:hypothetical protein